MRLLPLPEVVYNQGQGKGEIDPVAYADQVKHHTLFNTSSTFLLLCIFFSPIEAYLNFYPTLFNPLSNRYSINFVH